MRMPTAMKTLFPCPVDDVVAELPDAADPIWDVFIRRQLRATAQAETRTITFKWLVALEPGMPLDVVTPHYAPEPLTEAVSAIGEKLRSHYGGTVVRLLLTELPAGAVIPRHRDTGPLLAKTHRCHVPVQTSDKVAFFIDDHPYYLEAGMAYEVDNMRRHAVRNDSDQRRIHLICNILPEGVS